MKKNLLTLLFFFSIISMNAQTWELLGETPFSTHHGINFSIDGVGYSLAGTNVSNDFAMKHFYSYDPASDEWTQLADYPGVRRGFGIGDVHEGKAYIGFGLSTNNLIMNDLWEYDPDSDTWTELTPCPCTPRFHPAFVALNGKIFVGMGGSANGNLNDWWEYDIATDTWAQKPDFPSEVRHHPYQFAIGDYVYTGLGHGNNNPGLNIFNDWYRYDPATETWEEMTSLPAEGRVAGTQFSYDGKGYVLSGDGDNHSYMDTGEFWEYDPVSNTWTELPPHPGTSRWAPSSFMINGYVYFMLGISQSQVENTRVYRYQLDENPQVSTEDVEPQIISVAPNPTSDLITVQLENSTSEEKYFSLVNVNGQVVMDKTIFYNNTFTLDIQDFAVGVYFLKVELGDEVILKKVVKK